MFFNSFDFWDGKNGIACADPIDGEFLFIRTNDGGETWQRIEVDNLPKPLTIEAGFAASGTSVIVSKKGKAMYGTGGDVARVILSEDYGKNWRAIETPMKANDASLGVYSIASNNSEIYAITGGNWQTQHAADSNFAISKNGGIDWELVEQMPSGFRSCAQILYGSHSVVIVCGKNGVDVSKDLGKTWFKTKLKGYYSFDIAPNNEFIVFAGSKGRVGFINISK